MLRSARSCTNAGYIYRGINYDTGNSNISFHNLANEITNGNIYLRRCSKPLNRDSRYYDATLAVNSLLRNDINDRGRVRL